jgi:DNA-binding IclR family transcriptional regulator
MSLPSLKSSRRIQAIEVGHQLLEALVNHQQPMSLTALAKAAGMTPSKAHPYLASFGAVGLTEQNPVSGNYGLGPFAVHMGLVSLQQQNPIKVAIPEITSLAVRIEQTVVLAVWGTHGPTVVYMGDSNRPLHVNLRPGSVMSMLGTATGRIFSAFLPVKLVEAALAREMKDQAVLAQNTLENALQQHETTLADVRKRGLARVEGFPIPGISAFSAPVFDSKQSLALVITATGSSGSFDSSWDGTIARDLKTCAQSVSYRLGYVGR